MSDGELIIDLTGYVSEEEAKASVARVENSIAAASVSAEPASAADALLEGIDFVAAPDAVAEYMRTAPETADVEVPWVDERPFEELYSDESLWKAKQLILADKVHPDDGEPPILGWTVEGSTYYRVTLIPTDDMPVAWATCTCPNGEARGGRPNCYHTAAVLALVHEVDLDPIQEPPKRKRA